MKFRIHKKRALTTEYTVALSQVDLDLPPHKWRCCRFEKRVASEPDAQYILRNMNGYDTIGDMPSPLVIEKQDQNLKVL
jgi:hypothetical protein